MAMYQETVAGTVTGHSIWMLSCILGIIILWIKDSEVYILRKTFTIVLLTEVRKQRLLLVQSNHHVSHLKKTKKWKTNSKLTPKKTQTDVFFTMFHHLGNQSKERKAKPLKI